MLSVVQAARVVTGSILIIAGLIAIPLPLTPGLPLIIIGLAFGFSPASERVEVVADM
jgi:hypothetical protein